MDLYSHLQVWQSVFHYILATSDYSKTLPVSKWYLLDILICFSLVPTVEGFPHMFIDYLDFFLIIFSYLFPVFQGVCIFLTNL